MIRVPTRYLACAVAIGLVLPTIANVASASTAPRNPRFCASLATFGGAFAVLGTANPDVSEADAALLSPALAHAATAAVPPVRGAVTELAHAYETVAQNGPSSIFTSPTARAATTTFLTYYRRQCIPLTASQQAIEQALDLSFDGAVTGTFTVPDTANQCTVTINKTQLVCNLSPRGSLYRLDMTVSPYTGPGTYSASATVGSGPSVQLHQFDEDRNLAAAYNAVSGQLVIQRGDPNAGVALKRNAGTTGAIDAVLAAAGPGPGVTGTVHVSGTFACPISGGG